MTDAGCTTTVHAVGYGFSSDAMAALPIGVALVADPPADVDALAAAYRTASTSMRGASAAGAPRASIVAAGPVLDSPDQAVVRACRRDGTRIVVHVAHTSARLAGASLRRNLPWRPLLEIPATFPSGRYTVEVVWQAVRSLPDGEPLARPLTVGPVTITR